MNERGSPARRTLVYVLLIALSAAMLLPFAWLLRSSLSDDVTVIQPITSASDLLPPRLHWENYPRVVQAIPLWTYLRNTVLIASGVILGAVLSSSICAYAFAFCNVPYRKHLFYIVLATVMLPGVVTMIPSFILFRELGWIDTLRPLIVPAFFGNAFAIFLFRQFFLGIPIALIEAARIDGATPLQIYWRIVMPMSRPVIVTVALFGFVGSWNDFMGPLIYLNSRENWTLQLGLNSFRGEAMDQINLLMACAAIILIPVVIAFFCLQRYFISGANMSGLKG
jgi:ABC-type glycerol-3-phosphate transport system permease component